MKSYVEEFTSFPSSSLEMHIIKIAHTIPQ